MQQGTQRKCPNLMVISTAKTSHFKSTYQNWLPCISASECEREHPTTTQFRHINKVFAFAFIIYRNFWPVRVLSFNSTILIIRLFSHFVTPYPINIAHYELRAPNTLTFDYRFFILIILFLSRLSNSVNEFKLLWCRIMCRRGELWGLTELQQIKCDQMNGKRFLSNDMDTDSGRDFFLFDSCRKLLHFFFASCVHVLNEWYLRIGIQWK